MRRKVVAERVASKFLVINVNNFKLITPNISKARCDGKRSN